VSDVGVDELSPHRQVQRRPHDDVHLVHGLWGEAGAVPSAGRGELVVQPVEVIGPEPTERDATDRRVDVVVDHPRVAVRGGGSDVAALGRQPRVGEELTEVHRPASQWSGAGGVGLEAGGHLFGLVAVVAGGRLRATFTTSSRNSCG
jgi:hypothetical protein